MKTTIDLSDGLFAETRAYAKAHGVTFREVVESGLRTIVSAPAARESFRLRDCSVGGNGMVKDFTWPELRGIIYEGRGE